MPGRPSPGILTRRDDGLTSADRGVPCLLELQNPCRYPEAGARRCRPWIEGLLRELAPQAVTFTVRFVSDREMRRLNGTFRHRDRPTDVLSFPGDLTAAEPSTAPPSAPPWGEGGHLGDVAISVPTARRQAAERGHAVDTELRLLILHGVLHCLGFDHETDDGEMEALETRLRRRFLAADLGEGPPAGGAA